MWPVACSFAGHILNQVASGNYGQIENNLNIQPVNVVKLEQYVWMVLQAPKPNIANFSFNFANIFKTTERYVLK